MGVVLFDDVTLLHSPQPELTPRDVALPWGLNPTSFSVKCLHFQEKTGAASRTGATADECIHRDQRESY